jgi:hypothetical protein
MPNAGENPYTACDSRYRLLRDIWLHGLRGYAKEKFSERNVAAPKPTSAIHHHRKIEFSGFFHKRNGI